MEGILSRTAGESEKFYIPHTENSEDNDADRLSPWNRGTPVPGLIRGDMKLMD